MLRSSRRRKMHSSAQRIAPHRAGYTNIPTHCPDTQGPDSQAPHIGKTGPDEECPHRQGPEGRDPDKQGSHRRRRSHSIQPRRRDTEADGKALQGFALGFLAGCSVGKN